jgi:hypothetical protein
MQRLTNLSKWANNLEDLHNHYQSFDTCVYNVISVSRRSRWRHKIRFLCLPKAFIEFMCGFFLRILYMSSILPAILSKGQGYHFVWLAPPINSHEPVPLRTVLRWPGFVHWEKRNIFLSCMHMKHIKIRNPIAIFFPKVFTCPQIMLRTYYCRLNMLAQYTFLRDIIVAVFWLRKGDVLVFIPPPTLYK